MPRKPALHGDALIGTCIELLQLLSDSPTQTAPFAQTATLLQVSEDQLTSAVDTLCGLAHRQSGARVAVFIEDDTISLLGDVATFHAIRLSLQEGMVLAHVLNLLNIDASVRERVERAMLPLETVDAAPRPGTIGSVSIYGRFYQQIEIAIQDCVRLILTYRSSSDTAPRPRTVDPLAIKQDRDAAYLIGWDVEKDAQRLYRLDRVDNVVYTDDSVEIHPWENASIQQSLTAGALKAIVSFPSKEALEQAGWAGIADTDGDADQNGRTRATVYIADEEWLFDRVLGSGGQIIIESPSDLRQRLVGYAHRLTSRIS